MKRTFEINIVLTESIFFLIQIVSVDSQYSVYYKGVDGMAEAYTEHQDPENAAAVVGDSVTFLCGRDADSPPNSYLIWEEYITQYPDPFAIVLDTAISDGPNRRRYFAEISYRDNFTVVYNFTIWPVTLDDSGLYSCSRTFRGNRTFVQLVVLETEPVCETEVTPEYPVNEGEHLNMTCTVYYRGVFPPRLTWRAPPCAESAVYGDLNITEGIVTASIIFSANVWLNGSQFVGYLDFGDPVLNANQSNYADNRPKYTYSWYSPPVIVIGTGGIPPNVTPGEPCTSVTGHWWPYPAPGPELLLQEYSGSSLIGWFRNTVDSNWQPVDGIVRKEQLVTTLMTQAVAEGGPSVLTLHGECLVCRETQEAFLDITAITRTQRWDDFDNEGDCLPEVIQEVLRYRFRR